jgi:predicted lipoprotein with Yx(FWY)xxD motif
MRLALVAGLTAVGISVAAPALAQLSPVYQTIPARTANTFKGPALVDAKGLTLYTYGRDAHNKSYCIDQCAITWPPLLAAPSSRPGAEWTIFNREDGYRQWAYKGKPLYRYNRDKRPGDFFGDGYAGIWRIAKP